MILVSGAAGKTGQAVVGALVARGARVRGLVRRAEQESVVRKAGGAEVVVGDMLAGEAWERGVAGTTAVYHIPPNMHPDELKIGQLAIAAAGAAKVRCFGYHSVLWPQTEAMPHHWQKLRVEELLLRSGLAYVMVQPSAYMQNLAAMRARVVQEGVLAAPYGAESRLSLVDLGDVAEVVARLLVDEGLWYGSYGLCGTRGLSQREVAAEWGAVLGRVVRAERVGWDVWAAAARANGLDEYGVATLLKMFQYYDEYGLQGGTGVLSWLLGRRPRGLRAYLETIKD